jgi:hypothetical protein
VLADDLIKQVVKLHLSIGAGTPYDCLALCALAHLVSQPASVALGLLTQRSMTVLRVGRPGSVGAIEELLIFKFGAHTFQQG